MRNSRNNNRLELYIHIPFCAKKCRYCDFLSMPAETSVMSRYCGILQEEIREKAAYYKNYRVPSIFIGGGTPSFLPENEMEQIMECVKREFTLEEDAEITIECNPGTLTKEKLSAYKKSGINRISVGLQSAEDQELALLGRIHTYRKFLENYELIRNTGFANVNVDLMSALPGQTLQSYDYTLKQVLRLLPEHISAYSLIIEEGTPFYELYGEEDAQRERGENPVHLPSEETERAMYELTKERMEEYGYHRYEISNYAKSGYECRHNIGYWRRENYLGLGLGAASLVANCRFSNTADLKSYLEERNFSRQDEEILTEKSRMEEFMFLGLRMTDGVSKGDFYDEFGFSLNQIYGNVIKEQEEKGLLEQSADRVRLTGKGIDVSNYVMAEFLL